MVRRDDDRAGLLLGLAALALVAACHSSGAGDDYPLGPGGGGGVGGGGGGGGVIDAPGPDAADGDGGVPITGRVCLLTDMRKLSTCDPKAKGLVVTLGTRTTTTTNDAGDFSFTAQLGPGFTWHVTSPATRVVQIVPSVMPLGTEHIIPAIGAALYNDMLGANQLRLGDQQGAVVVRVVRGTAPVADVAARAPGAIDPVLYDDPKSLLDWASVATGGNGVVWLPLVPLANTPPTNLAVQLTPPGTTTTVTVTAPVENQSITFLTKDLP